MRSAILSLVGGAASVLAATRGFNYGSQGNTLETFEASFRTQQGLDTTSGWNSARLYTMIQDGTANTVISAVPAAIATNTTLLLGLWASETQDAFDNELTALKNAISQYGSSFADLVVGISVGSEDLYRETPAGIASNAGTGQSPSVLVDYIGQVRSAISGTVLGSKPVGHVDTWTGYTNSSNSAVIAAVDFIGLDEYPYYENTEANSVSNANSLFFDKYNAVEAVANGKPIWITETGWPTSGATENQAVPSVDNAETYWKSVACELLSRNIPTWWYILQDSASPDFSVLQSGETPKYDLSCPNVATSSSAAPTSSVASATMPTSAADSTTLSITNAVPTGGVPSSVAATSVADDGETVTIFSTTLITVTNCGSTVSDCTSTGMTSVISAKPSVTSAAGSTVVPSGTPAASGCPADINGAYQFPHLIVPVDAANPNKAYGTQYNATINSKVSTIFNFDIPASYAGKTCSTVFLFPQLDQLETSSYSFNDKGGFTIAVLNGVANESTTYANAPAVAKQIGSVDALKRGSSYTLSQDACPAGTRVSFEVTSTGGLDLSLFEDYNPSPLGLYVRAC
ncbi:glycoside hydrolase [Aureobasidium melanogenum CBS 110374]|uniref:Glycoside hydrolase n=1 Tax=Aureobasidium melanogenum (strain CBS 110374) TaxID=1043003 RepID=A0A074WR51_AURM1|nr:glycoside hydrolase [Aureobasidium melanogenum CBS 110374]KEQ64941.1 glycoside hydrolase [Aureobasidium melanogenum CBS 110374]